MQKNVKKKICIIAELGTSHGGDRAKALELVDAAAESGADCVKCQIVYADEILHPHTGNVTLPGGEIPLYGVFKSLERGIDFYEDIKARAEERGLLFLATPFGRKSAGILHTLGPRAVKIASPELNFTALLEETASWGVPMYLSTGVSTLGTIEEALYRIREIFPAPPQDPEFCPITLLHCVTAYPAPPEEYNLRVLSSMEGIFGVPVGVSDHTVGPILVPVLAAALGAPVIEKHFCLSRKDPGLDDLLALEPGDFRRMTGEIRRAAGMDPGALIEELRGQFGPLVDRTMGTGVKALAPSERANYGRTNRSIHALRDIAPGERIGAGMIGVLRTEKLLRPGLPPCWERQILGRKALQFIPAGEGIRFEDI
ncbi:MAG: N-acetylneuraminate synthase family protein [Spirochaetaceae bacterium]|jgi:sialic acid synthase SpsE|nr:N-acetylneuraminate synthase family protein [Spirochaetaceae bacterium]